MKALGQETKSDKNKMKTVHFLIAIGFILQNGLCERTKKKIYIDVSSTGRSACFRRLNGTHQIGCTSEPKGNVGVVHYVKNKDDLDWLLNSGPHQPYAVLLNASDFSMSTLSTLQSSGKVNGVMVIHVTDSNGEIQGAPPAFSPDEKCPNDHYGLYAGTEYSGCRQGLWNEDGSGMMFEDISFPIFTLLDQADVNTIIDKCYNQFNKPSATGTPRDYPLCAVQLKDRMDGAKDSETCIRRTRYQMNLNPERYCDPMGDLNVYATMKNMNNTQVRANRSVVVAAARMDSFSMFENIYPSADNHVSGIVALLAVAQALGRPAIKENLTSLDVEKDLMFTFFQGEAFDYIGSSRMVYDMQQNQFPSWRQGTHLSPVELRHINSFLEVNQLAFRDQGKVWIHTDPLSQVDQKIKSQVQQMVSHLKQLGPGLVDSVTGDKPLPPASVQSFLKNLHIPAMVVTDHQKQFTNKYYNSRFDLAYSIKASYPLSLNTSEWYDYVTDQAASLTQVSTMLARYLYKAVTGNDATDDIAADNKTVTHLLYCFLIAPNCSLFQEVYADSTLSETPYPFYVSVNHQVNEVTTLTQRVLHYFLGDEAENITDSTDCKNKNTARGKRVPVLIPNDTSKALTYITDKEVRKIGGVKSTNQYMFATKGDGIIRASECIKQLGNENANELIHPDRLTSTGYRAYMATIAQALQCIWMPGPLLENGTRQSFCSCGSTNTSLASSIAFEQDDYDYKSGKYPTWAESSWQVDAMDVRIFLVPSKAFETTTFSVGVVLLLLSLLFSYLINKRVDVLFPRQPWRYMSQPESDDL